MSGCVARLLLAAALIGPLMAPPAASAEPTTKASTKKAVDVAPRENRYSRKVFSGNEIRIAALHNVNADCSAGPIPDVRVATKPANGEIRLEEVHAVVDRTPEDRRAHCNGKPVDARGLFYKSADGFVGQDKVLIEVDFKTGSVRRFLYTIEVR
jgi:hypothetical protein